MKLTPTSLGLALALGCAVGGGAFLLERWRRAELAALREASQARIEELEHEVQGLRNELATAREQAQRALAARAEDPAVAEEGASALDDTLPWLAELDDERFGEWSVEMLRYARSLDLSGHVLTARDLERLAGLPALARLDLSDTNLGDADLGALARLGGLLSIDLGGTLVTDEGLPELTALDSLAELVLTGTRVGDAGMRSLAAIDSLRKLDLEGTLVTDGGLDLLRYLRLTSLGIGRSAITDRGLGLLEGFELEQLSLHRNTNVTDEGLRALARQPSLEQLTLRGTNLGEHGLAHLTHLPHLRELNAGLVATDAGMGHLGRIVSLEELRLDGSPQLTDAGARHLANLRALEVLQLQFTSVTDETLAFLENLPRLRSLDVRGTGVTPLGCQDFRARRPDCRLLP